MAIPDYQSLMSPILEIAAVDYVKRIEKRIVLIDGEQLAELMLDHNIGEIETKHRH